MDADNRLPAPELHFDPLVRRAGSIHLSIAGDIDMTTGDRFTRMLIAILDETDVHTVTLDVGQLHFIDSNGVTALIRTHWDASERGITFTVSNVGGPIREILEVLGVYDLLTATTKPPPEVP